MRMARRGENVGRAPRRSRKPHLRRAAYRHRAPRTQPHGVPTYQELPLDEEAEAAWAVEMQRLEGCYPGADEAEQGSLGHARGRLLRIAGVLALLADPGAEVICASDMQRAVVHMRYHLEHARRMLSGARGGGGQRERRTLIHWVRGNGGSCSVRELSRGPRKYREPGAAEVALEGLVEAKAGILEAVHQT